MIETDWPTQILLLVTYMSSQVLLVKPICLTDSVGRHRFVHTDSVSVNPDSVSRNQSYLSTHILSTQLLGTYIFCRRGRHYLSIQILFVETDLYSVYTDSVDKTDLTHRFC